MPIQTLDLVFSDSREPGPVRPIFQMTDATLHGMIEAHGGYGVAPEQLRLVDKYVDTWVYTADKNIVPFQSARLYDQNPNQFVKIPNGMEPPNIEPIPRGEMNIPDDAFVLCTGPFRWTTWPVSLPISPRTAINMNRPDPGFPRRRSDITSTV